MFAIHRCCVLVAIVCLAFSSAGYGDVFRAFQPVPDDAVAVAIMPHPRGFNDAINQAMDGMDRSTAIFGSRPIDQAKSLLRITVAFNELRSAAVAWVPRGDDSSILLPVWLVPVTDANDFLRGNFERIDAAPVDGEPIERIRHRRFGELHARAVGEHVAIARDRRALQGWQATERLADHLRDQLDDAGRHTLAAGDIALWIGDDADPRWKVFRADLLDRAGKRWPASRPLLRAVSALPPDHAKDTIVTLDLDPLGAFVRAWSRIDNELVPARPAREARHLRALPRMPYQFAVAMDQRGIALCRAIVERLEWERSAETLAALAGAHQLDFAAYRDAPSGILGRALVVLSTNEPPAAEMIRNALLPWTTADVDQFWKTEPASDRAAEIHMYEIRLPAEMRSNAGMLPAVLFGPAGAQGFAVSQPRLAALTFSRARPMRDAALDAMDDPGESLAGHPVLRSMTNWFPDDPSIVSFVSAGAMIQRLKPLLDPMVGMMELRLPDVSPDLPPVAMAAAIGDRSVEGVIIVPAGTLGIGYDLLGERFIRQRFLTPAEPRKENSADGS